ncbi:S8 family serine peptidase [Streptomyces griseochromogenes]|uniref:S8 family serine peptidase n=1 Tax=Streptomyces griseochromogenes TaxID=68214 RepID=UPI0037AA3ADE
MFLSQLFQGEPILEAVAQNETRINKQLNNEFAPVNRLQRALLVWDPDSLPRFGADGDYGDETASAVTRFKQDVLVVPADELIADVGPRTVWRLDEISYGAQDHPQTPFVPKVIVKLRDESAAQIPYEDNAQEFLPPEDRTAWDMAAGAFPDLSLTLNRALPGVDPEAVRQWLSENEAAHGTPSQQLLSFYVIPLPADSSEQVASAVDALPFVEHAYVEQEVIPASVTADDPLIVGQGYLGAAPFGVDGLHTWALPFTDGSQVRFVDVEWGWQLTHEDLIDTNGVNRVGILPTGTVSTDSALVNHGTNTLGIVMATDNEKGILGLAPNVKASVAPVETPAGTDAVAAALAVVGTIPGIGAGSVVLIEQQDAQHLPIETDLFIRLAIQELTRKRITVIEPAGNGLGAGNDLDTFVAPGHLFDSGRIFDRNDTTGAFFESGAVMVAAATSQHPHQRMRFPVAQPQASNHGNRIDCYAWGENILTTASLLDPVSNQPYRTNFGGTSGAAAIVAGVAVVLQNIRRSVQGDFLAPEQLRALLSDRSHNTGPAPADDGRIGVMPNLAELEQAVRTL